MKSILLANPKGGCGKTTLAVNLASYYARRGLKVALIDLDEQGSSMTWLGQRTERHPEIMGWHAVRGGKLPFNDTDVVVMDGPARIKSAKLERALDNAHVKERLGWGPLHPDPAAGWRAIAKAVRG